MTPYLIIRDVDGLITYLKRVGDAEEVARHLRPDGTVMHAVVRIGDSLVEMGEPGGEFAPRPASLHLYVEDCDAVYAQAVEAGGTSLMEPSDQLYGDREAGVEDPFGNHWYVAAHIRDLSAEELERQGSLSSAGRRASGGVGRAER